MNINWKFWIGLAVAAVILYAIVSSPVQSAAKVRGAGYSVGTFMSGVFK